MPHDVFVSYSELDLPTAEAVVAGLEVKGISCWIASRDVPQNSSLVPAVVRAIQNSKILVLILSANSGDQQVVRELEVASAYGIPFIPFRIEDISPSGSLAYFLKTEHWVDAFPGSLETYLDQLVETIRGLGIALLSMQEDKPTDQYCSEKSPRENENKIIEFPNQATSSETLLSIEEGPFYPGEQFEVVDTLEVQGTSSDGLIQFCVGDLTNAAPEDSTDVLVVWTIRDSYFPIPSSLIAALDQKGISVEALAQNKEVDLRGAFSCWLSREILEPPQGIQFKRVLCYEPVQSANAAEQVGDIFRSLAPFLGGSFPVRTVATPLLASGFNHAAAIEMMRQLVDATVHWMSSGLPLSCLKIVCLPDNHVSELSRVFSALKAQYSDLSQNLINKFSYDLFISYSHKDAREVSMFEQALLNQKNDIRIFFDRKNLNSGAAWQREIFESIDDSRKVAVFYSPTYLDSKVCIEEFNIALCRHRESDEPVLMPIYLYSANLPTYMRLVQFKDCREFNLNRLDEACRELIRELNL
jgi:hypothetical protein